MQDVMIICPTTQLPLATGVQISEAVFATAVFTNVRAICPHCEGEHRWNKEDAFLQEAKRESAGVTPPARFVRRGGRPPGQASSS
jgi:hypothetical protein